jgi:hypothetical protein
MLHKLFGQSSPRSRKANDYRAVPSPEIPRKGRDDLHDIARISPRQSLKSDRAMASRTVVVASPDMDSKWRQLEQAYDALLTLPDGLHKKDRNAIETTFLTFTPFSPEGIGNLRRQHRKAEKIAMQCVNNHRVLRVLMKACDQARRGSDISPALVTALDTLKRTADSLRNTIWNSLRQCIADLDLSPPHLAANSPSLICQLRAPALCVPELGYAFRIARLSLQSILPKLTKDLAPKDASVAIPQLIRICCAVRHLHDECDDVRSKVSNLSQETQDSLTAILPALQTMTHDLCVEIRRQIDIIQRS